MAKVMDWAREGLSAYVDNATSKRDFRAQLRGNRSAILWSVYLLALIAVAMFNYSDSVVRNSISVVQAQSSLQNFYQTVMILLGAMVSLVAPALSATAIVIERERRSLDLIFSAPVKPKTLLVGKLLSAYRYTWMLLVLSLPVTAVCVVLGGATWSEVLATYALLSLHGLLYSALALMVSSIALRPVSSLIWTYLSILGLGFATGGAAAASMNYGSRSNGFGVTFSPFFVVQAASSTSTIAGITIPNWVLFAALVLFAVRLFLLGAGSSLSPLGARETRNLRVTGLVAAGLLGAYSAALLTKSIAWLQQTGSDSYNVTSGDVANRLDLTLALLIGLLPMLLLIPLPFLVCYGKDADRKYWPNGTFSMRNALLGTPSGAMPYILKLLASTYLGVAAGSVLAGNALPGWISFATLLWGVGFWTFCWAIGQWASATTSELRSARTLHLGMLIAVLGLPIPFLALLDPSFKSWIWVISPFTAFSENLPLPVLIRLGMGAALFLVGLLIVRSAKSKEARRQTQPAEAAAA